MSAPVVSQQLDAASYSAVVMEPALAVIRNLLLRDHPHNVGEYISQHHSKIYFEIESAASMTASISVALAVPSPCSTQTVTETAAPDPGPLRNKSSSSTEDIKAVSLADMTQTPFLHFCSRYSRLRSQAALPVAVALPQGKKIIHPPQL
jgi:hypothetical protein